MKIIFNLDSSYIRFIVKRKRKIDGNCFLYFLHPDQYKKNTLKKDARRIYFEKVFRKVFYIFRKVFPELLSF